MSPVESDNLGRALPQAARAGAHAPEDSSALGQSEPGAPGTAGGWEPSNTHPPNTKVVASCLDTLYLGYRGALAPALLADLEEKRVLLLAQDEAARAAWDDGAAEAEFQLAGTRFVLRPSAHHGYRYRLFNDDLVLMVNPRPPPAVPAIMAQLRAGFLWREGWRGASALSSAIARALQDESAKVLPPMLSRLDACADFQGWIPQAADLDRFVCRGRRRDTHRVGAEFTGFSLGRGDIVARLYDKLRELDVSGKAWMHVVWQAGGYDPGSPVWRLEFQLRRTALRELHVCELSDLDGNLAGLWRYLTEEWLRLAVPIRGDRPERWPVDPVWQQLCAADFGAVGGALLRERKRCSDLAKLEGMLYGTLTSYAALSGHSTLAGAMRSAESAHRRRLAARGEDFGEEVGRKARRAGIAIYPP